MENYSALKRTEILRNILSIINQTQKDKYSIYMRYLEQGNSWRQKDRGYMQLREQVMKVII